MSQWLQKLLWVLSTSENLFILNVCTYILICYLGLYGQCTQHLIPLLGEPLRDVSWLPIFEAKKDYNDIAHPHFFHLIFQCFAEKGKDLECQVLQQALLPERMHFFSLWDRINSPFQFLTCASRHAVTICQSAALQQQTCTMQTGNAAKPPRDGSKRPCP